MMTIVSDKAQQIGETSPSLTAVRAGFQQAIKEAVQTMGATAPNPSVGCALLDGEGRLLAVGAHPAAGQAHAEIMALEQARMRGVLEQARIALVTLEPCNHHGRTPPCSEALKQSPVQTIWIGTRDPNPMAAGGAAHLAAGPAPKEVRFVAEEPALATFARECQALNAPFTQRVTQGRPWLSVKQALDEQGSMIPPKGQKTFTSPASLRLAHQLRRACDALVTGVGTVLADTPSFTVRHVADHKARASRPLIVLDRHNRLPRAWVYAREAEGFHVEQCRDLSAMPALLGEMGVNWALIEAGPTLLESVKAAGLWDDWLTIHHRGGGEADHYTMTLRHGEDGAISPIQLLRIYGG
ncbi:bifunctional diaminohydroxyphosphoribosylaminopyrimidine deaminase/5-amino-6-(5-phosphoribosylamino)uracil reductase RibD [Bombella sp. TMW 2.2556]|uniref:Riboflavin biosynthesis protein RibD n=2 Tax=Bombella pollinis TaxID=2967337 RepID=A0ABT3WK72_9PROT|nr:bifunctional diaminohydroxyphosphoribosylaminopyrimidine deaminase/5-amino-6-(5-phosphoribosylamino)uracil reductase RibD [Bombella pollinis]MCX5619083.1 bifunctional diaminohydroxyphosphoribosylaminopyrimidine deaminase/5-amino-6-(5-phosphoribosylamino)uracil reductase RibD [Bombella pollinis]